MSKRKELSICRIGDGRQTNKYSSTSAPVQYCTEQQKHSSEGLMSAS